MSNSKDILEDYEKMLDLAYSQFSPGTTEHKRFNIPTVRHEIMGRRGPTVIHNFGEICDVLNREPAIILKFLSKELGSPGNMIGSKVAFKGVFDKAAIEILVNRYVQNFIICPVCKSPDTRIIKEKRLKFLKCDACGARSSVRNE